MAINRRIAQMSYPFFIKYSSCFNGKLGLYFFAVFQSTDKKTASFSLEEAATVLNYSMKHIVFAYNECLSGGLLKEIEKVGQWVTVEIG